MWATLLRCPSCPQPGRRGRRRCGRTTPPLASHSRAPGGTPAVVQGRNAHRTICRNVLYRFHPWCGRDVFVHEVIEKPGGGAFRCTLDGSEVERRLEIPARMFDRAACAGDAHFSTDPFVSLEALDALSALLNQVLKLGATSSNFRFRSAGGISHDQNRGENHDTKDDGTRDRQSVQAAPRSTAVGFVRKPSSDRRTQMARLAEGSARNVDRSDGAADPGACADDHGADKGGGPAMIADKLGPHHLGTEGDPLRAPVCGPPSSAQPRERRAAVRDAGTVDGGGIH
jgi:hypothetical protein